MNEYRPELPPVPDRMKSLPIRRGYPVPWFVAMVDGDYHFPTADARKMYFAVQNKLCWVCGQKLGRFLSFVIGPMCIVNRITSEPATHRECAIFSAMACPFLARPHMKRVQEHAEGSTMPPGNFITRNPGTSAVWITKQFQLRKVDNGVLFGLGPPERVLWYTQGRVATRVEAMEALSGSLPILHREAERDGPEGLRELDLMYTNALHLLPDHEGGKDT